MLGWPMRCVLGVAFGRGGWGGGCVGGEWGFLSFSSSPKGERGGKTLNGFGRAALGEFCGSKGCTSASCCPVRFPPLMLEGASLPKAPQTAIFGTPNGNQGTEGWGTQTLMYQQGDEVGSLISLILPLENMQML